VPYPQVSAIPKPSGPGDLLLLIDYSGLVVPLHIIMILAINLLTTGLCESCGVLICACTFKVVPLCVGSLDGTGHFRLILILQQKFFPEVLLHRIRITRGYLLLTQQGFFLGIY
jgi:hypothetical protein